MNEQGLKMAAAAPVDVYNLHPAAGAGPAVMPLRVCGQQAGEGLALSRQRPHRPVLLHHHSVQQDKWRREAHVSTALQEWWVCGTGGCAPVILAAVCMCACVCVCVCVCTSLTHRQPASQPVCILR